MNATISDIIASLGQDGHVSASDVRTLRRTIFADGVVSPEELDALFALGERAPEGDKEWPQYFTEAAADFYLREEEPNGYLTDQEFHTLRERITKDGQKASALELELLIKLMETALKTPSLMVDFTIAQFKRHILEKPGGAEINAKDVSLLRRFIFAAGGDDNVAVTKREAELLFDLNDAAAKSDNDPSWPEFFKKAVANHLMAHIGVTPLGRREALQLQADFVDDSQRHSYSSRANFFSRLMTSLSSPRKRVEKRYAARNQRREQEAAAAEQITSLEADWLAERIGRDGDFDTAEQALIEHMRSLDADLPPKLKALLEKAA